MQELFIISLTLLEKSPDNLIDSRKGADWKVAVAHYLRESYLVPNSGLADT